MIYSQQSNTCSLMNGDLVSNAICRREKLMVSVRHLAVLVRRF